MRYLENELRTLNPKTNVVVYLTTSRTYYNEDGTPFITMRDCIGNHRAENYLEALELMGIYGVIEVINTNTSSDKVEITINREKGDSVASELDRLSNYIPLLKH